MRVEWRGGAAGCCRPLVAGRRCSCQAGRNQTRALGLSCRFPPFPRACRARDWVSANLTFEVQTTASFFEVVIRLLGGLMSAHDLSGEPVFLERARDLADRLLPAFNARTGEGCV